MRELTKSMLSFSWVLPLYGMKQLLSLSMPKDMSRPFGEATDGFQAVTGAMREHLGPTIKGLFDAGDQVQRGVLDVAFSFGLGTFDPNTVMQRSVQLMEQMAPRGGAGPGSTPPKP